MTRALGTGERRWRRNHDMVGIGGRTETDYFTDSNQLYGTGAEICFVDERRRQEHHVPEWAKYRATAWYKFGHLTQEREFNFFSADQRAAKKRCERWLDEVAGLVVRDDRFEVSTSAGSRLHLGIMCSLPAWRVVEPGEEIAVSFEPLNGSWIFDQYVVSSSLAGDFELRSLKVKGAELLWAPSAATCFTERDYRATLLDESQDLVVRAGDEVRAQILRTSFASKQPRFLSAAFLRSFEESGHDR